MKKNTLAFWSEISFVSRNLIHVLLLF